MSPKLKPLLLPQLVEQRRSKHQYTTSHGSNPDVYYTTNSSSSDITSPVTPTFSSRHQRYSSSSSSLDLPLQLQESPSSPLQPASAANSKSNIRQLPDVQEEPMEREYDDDDTSTLDSIEDVDHFGLYSCLCKDPCHPPLLRVAH
jgi:hypothetical protein